MTAILDTPTLNKISKVGVANLNIKTMLKQICIEKEQDINHYLSLNAKEVNEQRLLLWNELCLIDIKTDLYKKPDFSDKLLNGFEYLVDIAAHPFETDNHKYTATHYYNYSCYDFLDRIEKYQIETKSSKKCLYKIKHIKEIFYLDSYEKAFLNYNEFTYSELIEIKYFLKLFEMLLNYGLSERRIMDYLIKHSILEHHFPLLKWSNTLEFNSDNPMLLKILDYMDYFSVEMDLLNSLEKQCFNKTEFQMVEQNLEYLFSFLEELDVYLNKNPNLNIKCNIQDIFHNYNQKYLHNKNEIHIINLLSELNLELNSFITDLWD